MIVGPPGAGVAMSCAQALACALEDAAGVLGRHRRGQVELRVEAPLPAARIRHLQRAMNDSVLDVSGSALAGIVQQLGFSLAEVKVLLGLRASDSPRTCARVSQRAREKLAEIEAKIRDLEVTSDHA